jgi:hypothetical protein
MSIDANQNQRCVGCRARAPETETEYTLISSRFGWRLTRRIDRDGTFVMEWRCPTCWQNYKAERHLAMTPADGMPAFAGDLKPSTGASSSVRPELMREAPAQTPTKKK